MEDLTLMKPYVSPVNPVFYSYLATILLAIGLFFVAWFVVFQITANESSRNLLKEILVSLCASVFTGFGLLFLLLSVGIYV